MADEKTPKRVPGRKRRPTNRAKGKKLLGIAEMIKKAGVNPAEWEFNRLVENIQFIDECREYLDVGRVPPLFGTGTRLGAAKDMVEQLEADVMKESKTWREYILAKKRDNTTTVDGDLSLSLLDILQARSKK